jgi:hypothetical protein
MASDYQLADQLADLVAVLRDEIIRQSKEADSDAPWVDAEHDIIIRVDGNLDLHLLAEAIIWPTPKDE